MGRYTGKMKLRPYYNTQLMDQELVERLQAKSIALFGAKHRWQKLCSKARCTPEELEKRLDDTLVAIKEQNERQKQKHAVSRDTQRSESNNSEDNRSEARPEETDVGSDTPGSTE